MPESFPRTREVLRLLGDIPSRPIIRERDPPKLVVLDKVIQLAEAGKVDPEGSMIERQLIYIGML